MHYFYLCLGGIDLGGHDIRPRWSFVRPWWPVRCLVCSWAAREKHERVMDCYWH